MIEPNYPELVQLNCIPNMYHCTISGKSIITNICFGIRLDTNYYFSIGKLLGEKYEIKKWLDENYREKLSHVKRQEHEV